MVLLAPLVGAAVFFSGFAAALPTNYSSSSGGSGGSSYGSSGSDSSSYDSSGSDSSSYDSGSDSSSYGSSDSTSSYSSGYGSYGDSDSGSSYSYGGDSNYGDNSYSSSTMMMEDSSTMMMDSTETIDSTSTTTGYNSYETSVYGSGSSNWGGSGYQDCVNQCIAQYGSGMGGVYQATQTAAVGGYSGGGSGTTHTIIVAPTKGVLRFMPFATNASVGDTLEFHWGADNHTVTKSSALSPCNKSAEAPVFASGEQNTNFVFREMVNDTNPIFYYCGTPTHCEKGMFGVINPQMATPGSPTSLGAMMSSMAANDSGLSTYAAYAVSITNGNEAVSSWNLGMEMSGMPAWSYASAMENTLYTQNVVAMNPTIMKDNVIDFSGVSDKPLTLPMDPLVLNAASSGYAAASDSAAPSPAGADATSAGAAAPASSSSSSSSNTSGANSVASPRILVAAVVVVATIFAL